MVNIKGKGESGGIVRINWHPLDDNIFAVAEQGKSITVWDTRTIGSPSIELSQEHSMKYITVDDKVLLSLKSLYFSPFKSRDLCIFN